MFCYCEIANRFGLATILHEAIHENDKSENSSDNSDDHSEENKFNATENSDEDDYDKKSDTAIDYFDITELAEDIPFIAKVQIFNGFCFYFLLSLKSQH